MKTFGLVFALLLGSLRAQAATEFAATLRFTTGSFDGRYGPQHVMAAWIEDAGGRHILTLQTYGGGHRRHLAAWKRATRKADPQAADGVTGATLTAHRTHEIRWNGLDAKGQPVPDGEYVFLAEFTEDNGRGPVLRVPFRKGPKPAVLRPTDGRNFKGVELSVAP